MSFFSASALQTSVEELTHSEAELEYLNGLSRLQSTCLNEESTALISQMSLHRLCNDVSQDSMFETDDNAQSLVNTAWSGLETQHATLRELHRFQKKHVGVDLAKRSILRQFVWLCEWAALADENGELRGVSIEDKMFLQGLYDRAPGYLWQECSAEVVHQYRKAAELLSRIWDIHTRNSIRGAVNTLNARRVFSFRPMISIPGETTVESSVNAQKRDTSQDLAFIQEEGEDCPNGGAQGDSRRESQKKPRPKRVAHLGEKRGPRRAGSGTGKDPSRPAGIVKR